MTEQIKLSEKARELHKLSNTRKYSDNLHDYFLVLIDDDAKIQQILDFLNKNANATEEEIFDEIDRISPPPEIEIEDDKKGN